MDKPLAHTLVTEIFNFLESKAAGRTIVLMALGIVEQMIHAAIDTGLLDYLKNRDSLRYSSIFKDLESTTLTSKTSKSA